MPQRRTPTMPQENMGMGQEQPVMNPGAMGAMDQSQPQVGRPQPSQQSAQLQPLAPAVPGMEGLGASTPGGGDQSTDQLLQLLMSMHGGMGNKGY